MMTTSYLPYHPGQQLLLPAALQDWLRTTTRRTGRFATSSLRGCGRYLVTARALYRMGGLVRLSKWILRSVLLTLRLGWMLRAFGYSDGGVPDTVDAVVVRINSRPGTASRSPRVPRRC